MIDISNSLLNGLTPEYAEQFAAEHNRPELNSHNPLSNPKGVSYYCEICSRESHLQCSLCKRTYYCCTDHQEKDWKAIHYKICPYISALRSTPPILNTQEERAIRANQVTNTKKHVLSICKSEAFKHLNENELELARTAGLQALRYASDIYGNNALELVPPYLLLAEANIADQQFDTAEENLCQAKWILLQHPKADPSLKSQHSRNFGKLYAAQKKYDKALKYLAGDVYFTAQLKGPDHIETSVGLFLMGNVYIEKGDNESAVAMFEKVLSVWTPFLQKCISPVFSGDEIQLPSDWNETTEKLAEQILKKIVSAQTDMHGQTQIAVAQAIFANGLLMCVVGDWKEAFRLLASASQMFEVTAGSEHTLTRESHRYLQLAQKKKASSDVIDEYEDTFI
ncbi:zinc finger MYND domain-containing protein 12-like [Histomonas meleagridis]|uniref:zinc finger MYND domain-containing protein 12-like n=1 Tax=Histomonas meleagridis TaxID=135588 RepID=UPI00355AC88B|nr:zinc finger MYND domain-containing protein 12-like [Histomonas meleagridis]KAH0798599.1 zinc finger MYND domain-containing protein 12-like [Histomonas meleagridis]